PQLSAPRGNMSVTEFRRTNSIDNFYITEKVARAIFGDDYGKLESGTPSPKVYTADIKMSLQKMTHELQASDVLGFLPGTDLKDQIVVISAHMDRSEEHTSELQ